MIKLKVIAYNGRPPAQPLQSEFDELGGSIGRGDGNALVLPDPDRYVSRTHATIAFRNGGYVIRDLSSASPVQVNGRALGNGREAALTGGEEIQIGGYTLLVLADVPTVLNLAHAPAAARQGLPHDDPLQMFGPSSGERQKIGVSPEASRRTAQNPVVDHEGQSGSASSHRHNTIPTGFDPFAEPAASTPPGRASREDTTPPRLPGDLDLGIMPASSQDIDQLFGLNEHKGSDPFASDHPLAKPGEAGNSVDPALSLDPLVVMGAAPARPPAPPTQRDDAMEIRAAWAPPQMSPASAPVPQPSTPPDPGNMLVSWKEAESAPAVGEIKTVVIASPRQAAAAPQPDRAPAATVAPADKGVALTEPMSQPQPQAQRQAQPVRQDDASRDELLRAFLDGAGVPDLAMQGPMTPEMMKVIGQLLRISTQGTLDLLLARALIKRELHADVTMIAAHENNPLKFSPNVEVALAHLLAPRGQGFLSPVAAMKDACNDLRAHQFGFMAGMRAALDGVLRRFDPAQLEQRLTEKSILDAMLPINRKAKLWTLFAELYADINREAHDDFHALFGEEFLHAYQSQLDELEKNGRDMPQSDKR
jgi:type VI secretion system FHA domain protein